MNIRAIIFDLYGVLGLNGWQDFKKEHFGDDWSEWEPLRRLGQRVDAGEATDDEFVSAISKVTGVDCQIIRYQFEHTKPNIELLEFIESDLKPTYKIGLLSNTSRDVLGGIFFEKQRALFDAIVMSVSVGITKPDPTIFQMICDELKVLPNECLLVDDQNRHLVAAKSLGMETLLYTSAKQTTHDLQKRIEV